MEEKKAPAETKKEETKTEAAKEQAEQDSGERPYYVRPASEVTGKITVYTTMEETQQQVLNDIMEKITTLTVNLRFRPTQSEPWQPG